ncbi:hypothetical protein GPALN_003355 [Globodera pallida]|nr:hypothetical protein GPALN_003355 [Globodera pallida]
MREKRRQLIDRVRNIMPTEQLTEFNMDRWLDSYGEDVDLCEKMIHDYIKNRKALGVDNANFFNEIQKGWVNSYDNGIVFVEAGIADPSNAAKLIRSSDYLCAFFAFLEYMLQHVLEQEKLTNARSGAVCIFDMKNARVALAMAYYAEMLSKVVIVNPPRLLNVLFKILSLLLPGSILNRFHIAHNLADIQKWICSDAIPVGFGGQKCVGNAALSTGYNTPRQFENDDFLKVGTIWKQNSILSVNYEHHTLKASEVFVRQFNVKKGQKLIYEFYANRNFVIKFEKENGDYLVPHFPKMCTPVLSEEGAIKFDENDHINVAQIMGGQQPPPQPPPLPPQQPPAGAGVAPGGPGMLFTGTGSNLYYGVNLVPFGPENGDLEVAPGFLTSGQTIDLHLFFPFYGGLYNYTTISVNGYLGFATVLDQGPTINVGPDSTDWPRVQDPAMIAPYLCKQQISQDAIPGLRAGVFFRLMMRQSLFGRGVGTNLNVDGTIMQSAFFGQAANQACPSTAGSYVRCDANSDYFLDEMMRWLQEGVAGASAFRADAALVVTWYNTGSAVSGRSDLDGGQLATYQAIWLSDQPGRLSYVIINYDKLGFDAADFRANSRSGRCRALFNGGNHTGFVDVDPTQLYKNSPKILAQRSGVPHMVRGRYMFRVDDVVRPGGCSNKTGGTYPMLIYPNIVNMLGEMSIDVNAMCLDRAQTYILMVEQRQVMPISWYPRNFTNPDLNYLDQYVRISDDTLYAVQLGLYVIGYKEFRDDQLKKFRPEHRVLCRLTTYSNRNTFEYRWRPQEERINIYQVEQWYLNDWERMNELYTFRFGYLKLAPAKLDLGRFMPHPRCSQEFRDITCSEMIGAKNCYMSAQNVYGSYTGKADWQSQGMDFEANVV